MTGNAEHCTAKFQRSHLAFGSSRILATTLGETGGDTVTMTWDLGYLTGTVIFLSALIVLVAIQIAAKSFNPSFIGPRSLPQRRPGQPWQTLRPVLWGSATPAAH